MLPLKVHEFRSVDWGHRLENPMLVKVQLPAPVVDKNFIDVMAGTLVPSAPKYRSDRRRNRRGRAQHGAREKAAAVKFAMRDNSLARSCQWLRDAPILAGLWLLDRISGPYPETEADRIRERRSAAATPRSPE